MRGRKMKRTRTVMPIWICSRCFEIKELHSRGMCCTCYGSQYKAGLQVEKEKARKNVNESIAPVKIMSMRVEQIVRDWSRILKGAGFR